MKQELIERLYPLNRSLANEGTDKAFEIIKEYVPLEIHEIPSDERVYTWTVPRRWHVEHAYIEDDGGERIIDFAENPLYLASYSDSYTGWVTKDELMRHVTTSIEMPDHIPFSYKYYERDWHVSMEFNRAKELSRERYYVDIKTSFEKEYMRVGEYTLPGRCDSIVLLVSNICHPFQANDSITGVATFVSLMTRLEKKERRYTYKLLICPETIGSLGYMSKFHAMIPRVKCGIFSEMTGIDRPIRLIKSRLGDSIIDRVAEYVVKRSGIPYEVCPFFSDPCNDEKVFNSPGIDIPTISLVRWPYKEYHTSADTPDILNYERIDEAETIILKILEIMEKDYVPIRKYDAYLCLSNYGLAKVLRKDDGSWSDMVGKVLFHLDNSKSLFDIASKSNMDFNEIYAFCEILKEKGLLDPSPGLPADNFNEGASRIKGGNR